MNWSLQVGCKRATLVVTTLLIVAPVTHAAVFERDWKTPGDGLLTYDDVNQREWLDVPFTIEMFPVELRDPEPRYQSVANELGLGAVFTGFAIGNSSDLIALAQSAGIDTTTHERATNLADTAALIGLLGATYMSTSGESFYTRGLLNELEPMCGCRMYGNFGAGASGAGMSLFSAAQNSDDIPSRSTGVWLYREAVPEPATAILCTEISLLFLSRRRKTYSSRPFLQR